MSGIPKEMRVTGVVVNFNSRRGGGFIRPGLEGFSDVFISFREIEPDREGFKTLIVGDKVEFNIEENDIGNGYIATNLKIIRE